MSFNRCLIVFSVFAPFVLFGCAEAHCPAGDLAVAGACYPEDAVRSVDGGVPRLCPDTCGGSTPNCDFSSATCVACAGDSQCDSPSAAACDPTSKECVPCSSDANCEHVAGAPHCDPDHGRCVQCHRGNELSICGSNSCDALSGLCTTTTRGSQSVCESCRSDSECAQGQRCVEFAWFEFAPERVCLWDTAAVNCATNATSGVAPYVIATDTASVHGDDVRVCAPPSACAAVFSYAQHKSCNYTSDCGGPTGASLCDQGHCTMSCFSVTSGYAGCTATDSCSDGVFCRPNP